MKYQTILLVVLAGLLISSCTSGVLSSQPTSSSEIQNYILTRIVTIPEGIPPVTSETYTEIYYIDQKKGNRRFDLIKKNVELRRYDLTIGNKITSTRCDKEQGLWNCKQLLSRDVTEEDLIARTTKSVLPDISPKILEQVENKNVIGINAKCYRVVRLATTMCYHPEYPDIVLYEEMDLVGIVAQATNLNLQTLDESFFILPPHN